MAIHKQVIELTIFYGSDTQQKIWKKAIDSTLQSIRDVMEQTHKDNLLDMKPL